jgi:two-component system, LytTR family, response regulator LytT
MLLLGICDDLKDDRLKIVRLVKDCCIKGSYDIRIIHFENGESLVKYYVNGKIPFDIIFLDIYMNGKNGVKTAEQIREYDSVCKIIFTTSSSEHALESFKVYPFNYLTKPIFKSIFNDVFEKALKDIDKEKQKSLSIKVGSNIKTVFYKNILFIESDAKVLNIHMTQAQNFSFKSKLDEIQNQINDKRFLRCHKSYLVNMDNISSAENYFFKLSDNTLIPITQRHFANIKKIFYDYIMDKANLE